MAGATSAKSSDLDALEAAFEAETDAGQSMPNKVDLRKKVRQTPAKAGDIDPVAAAEAAVGALADKFDDWMANGMESLFDCWSAATELEFEHDTRDSLFRAAHDIKGQAATLGYPQAGHVAASLCTLLSSDVPSPKLPRKLVDQHVQAIRAIVAEGARDNNKTARSLADALATATEQYLASAA